MALAFAKLADTPTSAPHKCALDLNSWPFLAIWGGKEGGSAPRHSA